MIGALLISGSLNRLGRRLTIQIICVICVVSAAIQGGSVHIAMVRSLVLHNTNLIRADLFRAKQFLVGRFLNGVGVGMMQVSVPIYQSELSPAKQRGRLVGAHGILIVCGYVRRRTSVDCSSPAC